MSLQNRTRSLHAPTFRRRSSGREPRRTSPPRTPMMGEGGGRHATFDPLRPIALHLAGAGCVQDHRRPRTSTRGRDEEPGERQPDHDRPAPSSFSRSVEVHRLDQVAVAAGLARPLPVALLAPAGQGDDRHRLAPTSCSRMRRVASSPFSRGMPDVHQDHLGPEPLGRLHRLEPVVRGPHLVAQQPQHHGQAVGPVAVVVHHEDAPPGARRGRPLVGAAAPRLRPVRQHRQA